MSGALIDTALTAFVTLFVIIDPVGLTPIFLALTHDMTAAARRAVAARACLIGLLVMAAFGLVGEALLQVVGIGLPAFRIAGGILLFLIAVEMLFERRSERRGRAAERAEAEEAGPDPSVFPLAVPLLAGPGALASMILLMGRAAGDLPAQAAVMGVMAGVVALAYVLFRLSGVLGRFLGRTGINVVTRLLGMLLAALAVQFVIDGLRDVGALTAAAG